jgi:hypothetical protein
VSSEKLKEEEWDTYKMAVLLIENSVASTLSFDVFAVDSGLLVIKLTIKIATNITRGPVECSAFFVAATNVIAAEVLHYSRSLDVSIDCALLLTLVLSEAGVMNEVSHISIPVFAPNPTVASWKTLRCFVYIVTAWIVITLVSFPVATTHITIGVCLNNHFESIIVITLMIALGRLKAGVDRDIPNVSIDAVQITVDPLSGTLEADCPLLFIWAFVMVAPVCDAFPFIAPTVIRILFFHYKSF